MQFKSIIGALALFAVVQQAGWAQSALNSAKAAAALDQATAAAVRASFREEGGVKLDVLTTDASNRACSAADVAGKPLTKKAAAALEKANLKTIQPPPGGVYLGSWQEGEKIAQSGRGLTFTDESKTVNGGNCYNCHQIDKKEIAFGTIGPSLYNYAKLRGVTDPRSKQARPIVEYTWGKIWNARAFNACSNMPRFGHNGILSAAQIADLMALLLDPQSPVNQ